MIDEQPPYGLPAALVRFLDRQLELDERAAALNDPDVPSSALRAFLFSLSPDRREVALSMCEKPSLLAEWAARGNVDERVIVAFNPHTPSAVLRRLVGDPAPRVRMQIAFNPNSEPDVLAELLLDPDPVVEEAITCAFDTYAGHQLRAGVRTVEFEEERDDELR